MELRTVEDLKKEAKYEGKDDIYCIECGGANRALVQFYDDLICEKCLIKALLMVRPIDDTSLRAINEWLKPFLESEA